MSWLQARHTILVKTRQVAGVDSRGNKTYSWVDRVVPVYGWYYGEAYDVKDSRRPDGMVWSVQVFLPVNHGINAVDRVVLRGVEHEIVGDSHDYEHSPFPGGPTGCVLHLRRAI